MKIDLSLVLSGLSLAVSTGLTVWMWRWSGPRVQVSAAQMVLATARSREEVTEIMATNSGRAAVNVTNWAVILPNGQGLVYPILSQPSAALPHRLEPGSQASWFISTAVLVRDIEASGFSHEQVRARIHLGNGKAVTRRRSGIGLAATVQPDRERVNAS
jgi:hypothetical protein